MRIIINAEMPEKQEERIRTLSSKFELVHVAADEPRLSKTVLKDTEVIYTSQANFDPADAPRLRWVQVNTAAINHFMQKPIARSRIPIANVRGAYSVPVAECAMGMLLAVTRRITLACRFQFQQKWPADYGPFKGEDLDGKTMGIVGYGSVGRQIARLAQAMNMKVLACKKHPEQRKEIGGSYLCQGDPDGTIPQAWFGIDRLPEMFRICDVAMVTLPLTNETRGLIGKRELEALPARAYVVVIGRGFVVDEDALAELLKAGKLAGAALDVFANEPLEPESPFWKMPNVLIMPHIASWTDTQTIRATNIFIENLSRDLRGESLINVIDPQRGF